MAGTSFAMKQHRDHVVGSWIKFCVDDSHRLRGDCDVARFSRSSLTIKEQQLNYYTANDWNLCVFLPNSGLRHFGWFNLLTCLKLEIDKC